MRAISLLCLLVLVGTTTEGSEMASITYSEPMKLKWGKVSFLSGGEEFREEVWYAERPPTFSAGGVFSATQKACLSNSFNGCIGEIRGKPVWRITDSSLSSADPESFKERATRNGCGLRFGNFGPAPEDWSDGRKSVEWTLWFTGEMLPPPPPPSLEMALLVADVPAGVAWEIPISRIVHDPAVQRYSGLSTESLGSVLANTNWMRVFVAAPPLRAPPHFPAIVPHPETEGLEAPLGFALLAMQEAASLLGQDRSFSDTKLSALKSRLSPELGKSSTTYRWFPEPDESRKHFPNIHVLTDRTGALADSLVRISMPSATGSNSFERVLPETNEWAIRAGPFRRLQPAIGRVGFIKGRSETNHPVESLSDLIKDEKRRADWESAIDKVEAKVKRAVPELAAEQDFFWVPGLADEYLSTVRKLERTRYVGGVQTSFLTNHFQYDTIYKLRPVTGKLGVFYDPEHRFGGEAGLEISDWPRPGDNLSLKGTFADELLEGTFNFMTPYHRSLDRRTKLNLLLFAQAGRDDIYRLGSLSQEEFEHRYENGGIEHLLSHDGAAWNVTLANAVLWDGHELRQPGFSDDDSGLLLRNRLTWRIAPQPFSGTRWEHSVAPSFVYGPSVGWDESFVYGELEAGSRVWFGGDNLDSMYVGLRGSFGSSSRDLPAALLFRLGDVNRLFGLEPGEFSGRSYTHGELSYGVSLKPLFERLFRDKDGKPAPPPALDGLGLQVLAEIGSIATDDATGALTSADDLVASYGVAFEKAEPVLGGAGFRMGYAWSPESRRSGGRVFAALNWNF